MRKVDVVTKISDLTGIPKTDVLLTLEAFFKEVKNQVKVGESVYVRGFGSFVPKKRAQKLGRIISRGETVVIPEHYIPAFKPAKIFMDQVKKYKPAAEGLDGASV
jgi:DNA-binding protein HU-beta